MLIAQAEQHALEVGASVAGNIIANSSPLTAMSVKEAVSAGIRAALASFREQAALSERERPSIQFRHQDEEEQIWTQFAAGGGVDANHAAEHADALLVKWRARLGR